MPPVPDATLSVLLATTASLAVAHAALGIDHSLPFVVLARARGWSFGRTMGITVVCGLGHVASSVVIGGIGALAGTTLDGLMGLESARGELAAMLLFGFGLSYAAWALVRLRRGHVHSHLHAHADGTVHDHPHDHHGEHLHPHDQADGRSGPVRRDGVIEPAVGRGLTPWALFVVLALGPCEPLIPLMVVPALDQSWGALVAVVGVFTLLTVGTMAGVVALGFHGLAQVPTGRLVRYADVAAGLVVAASGGAVLWLGV